jgi:Flp pilus assembly protein TadG
LTDGDREAGQSMVELALMLALLITLVLGVTDFARYVGEYIQVVNAANAGAQYAAAGSSNSQNTAGITAAAQTDLGSLYPAPGATINVSTANDGTSENMTKATVTVTIPYHVVTPFIGTFLPTMNLSSSATMRVNPFNP